MARLPTPVAVMAASTALLAALCLSVGLPVSKPSELKQLSDANTDFGVALYHKIRHLEDSDNVFFSPWSITTSLAMTYAGASASTKEQMAEVLKLKDIDEVHRKFRDLTEGAFKQPPGTYTLKQANKLYGATRFSFKESFLNILQNLYHSPLEKKNFATKPELARNEINLWVEQQTEQKIKDLLPEGSITDMTVLVLVNALYFKAKWKTPFHPKSVVDGRFYLRQLQGGRLEYTTVPMMVRAAASVMYTHNTIAKYKMLELPYSGNHVSMFVCLPDEPFGIDDVTEYLNADNIRSDMRYLEKTLVHIRLPKFQIRASFKLKRALEQLGMRDAFSDTADFSNMTDGLVKISDVYHQAFVDVNEEGTEAAAATGTVVISRSANIMVERFTVDHPFLFFIRENRTGSILFMGKIGNPQPSQPTAFTTRSRHRNL